MGDSIDSNQDYDGFEIFPFLDGFIYVLNTGLIDRFAFFLIDNSVNFGNVLLSLIEEGNITENCLSLLFLVFVHQYSRWLLKVFTKHDQYYQEGNKLENNNKVEPVQFHNVEETQHDRNDSTKIK